MKLRFNINTPNSTGSPDYTICNQASSFVSFTNLGLVLKIDGTDIINTANLASVSFPISPITTTNGLTVAVAIENTNYIKLTITGLTNIWDSTTAEFIVEKTGYYSFSKVFEIYGYDLGINPNVAATSSNPKFDIVLIDKTNNEVNGHQTKAYSSFIAYKKPYTNELYIYKNNSGGGQTLYYNSDLELISINTDGFICTSEDYDIKQTNNIISSGSIISTCTTDFLTVLQQILIPTFEANTTCTNCDEECTVVGSTNNTTTYIDYNLLTVFIVDDVEVTPYLTQSLIYRLYDFTGNEIASQEHEFDIDETYDPTAYKFEDFVLPEVGDYIIQVELSVTDLYSCKKNYPVKSCNFYEIKNTDCNEFTIYNRSFEAFAVSISELQNDKTFAETANITIDALGNSVITHSEDGIFTYTIVVDDVTYTYIVINYCNLRTCLLAGISTLLCSSKENCDTCKAKNYYDFNTLIVTAHTYFNMLNSEYNFNYLYEAISDNKLNELYDLKTFLTRFKEYCIECNSICSCNCN